MDFTKNGVKKKTRWETMLQAQMSCRWKRSEEKDQTGSSWQECYGSSYKRDYIYSRGLAVKDLRMHNM